MRKFADTDPGCTRHKPSQLQAIQRQGNRRQSTRRRPKRPVVGPTPKQVKRRDAEPLDIDCGDAEGRDPERGGSERRSDKGTPSVVQNSVGTHYVRAPIVVPQSVTPPNIGLSVSALMRAAFEHRTS